MLSKITKQKSLAILQLIAALFILTVPSVIGEMPLNMGAYLLMIVFSALLCIRIKSMQKIDLSFDHLAYLALGLYAVLTSLWAGNREGNLLYIVSVFNVMIFHSLAKDYFTENPIESIKRRILYLISASGVICSIVNFVYWMSAIVPVAGKTALFKGLGTNDFLAVFLYFSITATLLLVKSNSKSRRTLLYLAAAFMAFVFVLAKSALAWILAVLFTIVCFVREKEKKTFMIVAVSAMSIFFLSTILIMPSMKFPTAFSEVFAHALKHPYGLGGGFWSARETFSASSYTSVPYVGLFGYLFASGGILGLITCVLLFIKSIILFIRLKNISSVAGVFLCIATMLVPFGVNIAVVLFLIGLTSYNEQQANISYKLTLGNRQIFKTMRTLSVVMLIAALCFLHGIIKLSAENAYKNKSYSDAYHLYRLAGDMNICDSESLRMAAASLRKSGEISASCDTAVKIIDRAIKRDRNNVKNIKEKALVYDACEEFELSAQQYRDAAEKAFNNDEYNLLLVKELYKIVKKSPKGSVETKRSYEEIIKIAQSTDNLDLKKEINDIADKAFKYTKGEFISEE